MSNHKRVSPPGTTLPPVLLLPKEHEFIIFCKEDQAIYTRAYTLRYKFDLSYDDSIIDPKRRLLQYTSHIPHLYKFIRTRNSEQCIDFMVGPEPRDLKLRVIWNQLNIISSIDGACLHFIDKLPDKHTSEHLVTGLLQISEASTTPELYQGVYVLDTVSVINRRIIQQRCMPIPFECPIGPKYLSPEDDISEYFLDDYAVYEDVSRRGLLDCVAILTTMVADLSLSDLTSRPQKENADYLVATTIGGVGVGTNRNSGSARHVTRHAYTYEVLTTSSSYRAGVPQNLHRSCTSSTYMRAISARRFGQRDPSRVIASVEQRERPVSHDLLWYKSWLRPTLWLSLLRAAVAYAAIYKACFTVPLWRALVERWLRPP